MLYPLAPRGRPPPVPRSPPIRSTALAFLLAVLTFLAAIAVWAGLQAWPTHELRAAETAAAIEFPTPLPEPERGPLPPVEQPVQAAFTRSVPPRDGRVELSVVGVTSTRRMQVSILDAETGAPLATSQVDSAAKPIGFTGLPRGAVLAVAHEPGRSPRFAWLARALLVTNEPDTAPRVATLDVTGHPVTIRIQATAAPPARRWTPVSVALSRVDDPDWNDDAVRAVAIAFEPGSADHELELGPLAAGRYRVRMRGFEVEGDAAVEFDVPSTTLLELRGMPR